MEQTVKSMESTTKSAPEEAPRVFTVYRRRWLVLGLYVLFCVANAMQWIQYAIIGDVIVKFYGVGYSAVNWTSMIYMLVYVPFIFPATWLLNKKGLRFSVILGSIGNCLGAWIKFAAVSPDLFWLAFVGQTVAAIAQVYVLSVPSAVAAIWFGPGQVSTACAIGVFGLQVGNALGFLLPPLMVKDHEDLKDIGADLSFMLLLVAIFTTVLLVLIVIFLQSAPPSPPSAARANRVGSGGDGETPRQFVSALWRVMRNPRFVLLFLSFGVNVGVFSGLTTFLNQMVLTHYPDAQVGAGNIGVTFIVSGIFGTVVFGFVLDQTRKFKETLVAVYVLSLLGMLTYTLLLGAGGILYVYLAAAFVGFFMIGYLPVGFEFGAELTYPESEATSAGVLSLGSQLFAVSFSALYGAIFSPLGDQPANYTMCATLLLGSVLSLLIKSDLRRQRATNAG